MPKELFESVFKDFINVTYPRLRFFTERDIVWGFQSDLWDRIRGRHLPFRMFHEYPMIAGKQRAQWTDLAILSNAGEVEVAAEFKYEPDHARASDRGGDIWHTKLNPSVVFWGADGVAKDVARAEEYVARGIARHAYSIFIDEGGHFLSRPAHPNSKWIRMPGQQGGTMGILWAEFHRSQDGRFQPA